MANRYFRNTGNTNWSTATNWSTTDGGGADAAVPVAADAVFLTALSGNVNMTANGTCTSLNFTGYSGTFSGSFQLSVSASVVLSPTMTVSATTLLILTTDGANLTSNGKVWSSTLQVNGSNRTYNFLDNWTVLNFVVNNNSVNLIGNNVFVQGNFSYTGVGTTSTTVITMTGTGTVSSSVGNFNSPLVINTAGTITFSGSMNINRSITYIAGTVVTTGSTLNISASTGVTVDTRGVVWNNIALGPNIVNDTFLSDFICANLSVTLSNSASAMTVLITPGIVFRVTASFIATATDGNTMSLKNIQSTVPGTRANFTLQAGATCSAGFIIFTDINASAGRAVNIYNGITNNCLNVVTYNDPVITQVKSFAA